MTRMSLKRRLAWQRGVAALTVVMVLFFVMVWKPFSERTGPLKVVEAMEVFLSLRPLREGGTLQCFFEPLLPQTFQMNRTCLHYISTFQSSS